METGRKEKTFDVDKVLGKGGNGEVVLVKHKLDGHIYALKTVLIHVGIELGINTSDNNKNQVLQHTTPHHSHCDERNIGDLQAFAQEYRRLQGMLGRGNETRQGED